MSVVVTEVHVHGSTSLVDLSDTERYEQAVFLNTSVCTGLDQSFSHLRAEGAHL